MSHITAARKEILRDIVLQAPHECVLASLKAYSRENIKHKWSVKLETRINANRLCACDVLADVILTNRIPSDHASQSDALTAAEIEQLHTFVVTLYKIYPNEAALLAESAAPEIYHNYDDNQQETLVFFPVSKKRARAILASKQFGRCMPEGMYAVRMTGEMMRSLREMKLRYLDLFTRRFGVEYVPMWMGQLIPLVEPNPFADSTATLQQQDVSGGAGGASFLQAPTATSVSLFGDRMDLGSRSLEKQRKRKMHADHVDSWKLALPNGQSIKPAASAVARKFLEKCLRTTQDTIETYPSPALQDVLDIHFRANVRDLQCKHIGTEPFGRTPSKWTLSSLPAPLAVNPPGGMADVSNFAKMSLKGPANNNQRQQQQRSEDSSDSSDDE